MPGPIKVPDGARGFDVNRTLTAANARAFAKAGYTFALRYIPRAPERASDLSRKEIETLFLAGLAVMPVQHVESDSSWTPTDDKARAYGEKALAACVGLKIPAGVSVWLDLEGVATDVGAEQIVRYCNGWYEIVKGGGYLPGLYVGWHAGLTPDQLYWELHFSRYWAAFNLNRDQYPAVRGVCMKQHAAKKSDYPPKITFEIDTDTVALDEKGGLPVCYAPDEWGVLP